MRLAMIGAGYVGLISGVGFAVRGHDVICVDLDPKKIDKLSRGEPTIHEKGLADALSETLKSGKIEFTTQLDQAIERSDTVFICVGTPTLPDGTSFVDDVVKVAESIADFARRNPDTTRLVVIKSTVPVGTTKKVAKVFSGLENVHVANNPEFLREGTSLDDFLDPDRVVIGTDSEYASLSLRNLYDQESRYGKVTVMDSDSSELVKYTSNAMLAIRLAFVNEVAQIADKSGADMRFVMKAVGMDPRIGPKYLSPGPGFGGSCLPKDVYALSRSATIFGASARMTQAAIESNSMQRRFITQRLEQELGSLKGKKICIWGLSFKAGTDDVRYSQSLFAIHDLLLEGAIIQAHDPEALENAKNSDYILCLGGDPGVLDRLSYFKHRYAAAEGVDAIVIMTEWPEYDDLFYFQDIGGKENCPIVFDTRNLLTPESLPDSIKYIGMGTKKQTGFKSLLK